MELVREFLNHASFSIESEGTKILDEFLSHNKHTSPDLLYERLASEHARLFGGLAYGHSPPPPYESVWSGEGRVMGQTTVAVLKVYAEAGMEVTPHITVPPDHIGIELSYLSHLCSKEAEARRGNDADATAKYLRMQHDFLHYHVQRWVPNFCRQIAKNDRTGLYRGIAILTTELVLADQRAIPEELREDNSSNSATGS
jgi:TorA maturation chaperone TorD